MKIKVNNFTWYVYPRGGESYFSIKVALWLCKIIFEWWRVKMRKYLQRTNLSKKCYLINIREFLIDITWFLIKIMKIISLLKWKDHNQRTNIHHLYNNDKHHHNQYLSISVLHCVTHCYMQFQKFFSGRQWSVLAQWVLIWIK